MVSEFCALFIDVYDSFLNNIIALLEAQLGVQVAEIYNDAKITVSPAFLEPLAAIVCGPGPGHPSSADETGLIIDERCLGTCCLRD